LLVLKTHLLDRLKDFYTALGISFTEEQHGKGPSHYAGTLGELTLELYPLPAEAGPADASTRLGFGVSDVDGLMSSLEEVGGTVVTGPRRTEWGYRAVVRDPDGRAVELCQGPGPGEPQPASEGVVHSLPRDK
jgi:predicted enzyme related to lactoylglutathione lyase